MDRWIEEAKESLLSLKVKLAMSGDLDVDRRRRVFDLIGEIQREIGYTGDGKREVVVRFFGGNDGQPTGQAK